MSGIIGDNTGRGTGLIKAAGGGVWTFISKTTISADSSEVDIESGIDSTYPLYVLIFRNIRPASDDGRLWARVKVSSYQTSGYQYGTLNRRAGHGDGIEAWNNDDAGGGTYVPIVTSDAQGNLAVETYNGHLFLPDPSNTTTYKNMWFDGTLGDSSGDFNSHEGFGGYDGGTGAVTGIRFYFNTGNITSGIICLYGIKDS